MPLSGPSIFWCHFTERLPSTTAYDHTLLAVACHGFWIHDHLMFRELAALPNTGNRVKPAAKDEITWRWACGPLVSVALTTVQCSPGEPEAQLAPHTCQKRFGWPWTNRTSGLNSISPPPGEGTREYMDAHGEENLPNMQYRKAALQPDVSSCRLVVWLWRSKRAMAGCAKWAVISPTQLICANNDKFDIYIACSLPGQEMRHPHLMRGLLTQTKASFDETDMEQSYVVRNPNAECAPILCTYRGHSFPFHTPAKSVLCDKVCSFKANTG